MSNHSTTIAELTPEQRALLELQLKKRRENSARAEGEEAATASVRNNDDENLVLVETPNTVDQLLGEFYKRFPWPWQPVKIHVLEDPDFETVMLNQDLGDWDHRTATGNLKIWVAGCGTNQALLTALRFPKATVIGSDVSTESLEICGRNAKELGVSNLELKEESLNHVSYEDQFDYVISTGVIHHNANPQATLEKLAAALKPTGILELMVYNRFHRTLSSAFQKAIRILGSSRGTVDFESDLAIAKKLVANFPTKNNMSEFLTQEGDGPESDFADLLIHPVEHSYTVESLEQLVESCGLELLFPCLNSYVKFRSPTIAWNLQFNDPELQSYYDQLPDTSRWQVTNLLLHERSSLLWFYIQRKDSGRQRKSEKQVCEEFLERRFEKSQTIQTMYKREDDGKYKSLATSIPYPSTRPEAAVKAIFEAVDAKSSMREIFERLGIETTFAAVNQARINLTTSAFPYLKSIQTK